MNIFTISKNKSQLLILFFVKGKSSFCIKKDTIYILCQYTNLLAFICNGANNVLLKWRLLNVWCRNVCVNQSIA